MDEAYKEPDALTTILSFLLELSDIVPDDRQFEPLTFQNNSEAVPCSPFAMRN
jgi:hypothetical protein